MDYVKLFYWLTVADSAGTFFGWMVFIFTTICLISTLAYFFTGGLSVDSRSTESGKEEAKFAQGMSRKWMWWCYPFAIIFWLLFILTPSKKDALLIIAGGMSLNYLTQDEEGKKIPKEIQNFVITELRLMAKEAKVEIGVLSEKEKLVKDIKSLTTEELLKKLKENPDLIKLLD